MELAKDCLDVGLYTNDYEAMSRFYTNRIGLAYEELLKVGRGIHQHRLSLRGAVLKLNSSREPLPPSPTNFLGFDIGGFEPGEELVDTTVRLVPAGQVTIHWASSAPDRLWELLMTGFGASESPDGQLQIGRTAIAVEPGGGPCGPMRSRGFRYITVQVSDVRSDHAFLVKHGWREATAPVRLGDTAFISVVSDPDGAMVEVSQRASLTGPLPDP